MFCRALDVGSKFPLGDAPDKKHPVEVDVNGFNGTYGPHSKGEGDESRDHLIRDSHIDPWSLPLRHRPPEDCQVNGIFHSWLSKLHTVGAYRRPRCTVKLRYTAVGVRVFCPMHPKAPSINFASGLWKLYGTIRCLDKDCVTVTYRYTGLSTAW